MKGCPSSLFPSPPRWRGEGQPEGAARRGGVEEEEKAHLLREGLPPTYNKMEENENPEIEISSNVTNLWRKCVLKATHLY